MAQQQTAIIVGAGPAGLTAAYELLQHSEIRPIVLEADGAVGGLSRTVTVRGNRIDIGGHRFFSKSDAVMRWWTAVLPIERNPISDAFARYGAPPSGASPGPVPDETDLVMLVRKRTSRILHRGVFYDYLITLDPRTLRSLGVRRVAHMVLSLAAARARPRPERSLEDFYVNRFGRVLYETFFRDYTEKVWGVNAREIAADWGAQRVKGLSIRTALAHAIRERLPRIGGRAERGEVETSLIEHFLYPKYGPGQLWERVAELVVEGGGEVRLGYTVTGMRVEPGRVVAVDVVDSRTGQTATLAADHVLSTMPVADLIASFTGVDVPADVRDVARGLRYRDFITVGVLASGTALLPDTWIYVQDAHVRAGRVQVFNNWSPWLVADRGNTWLGLEYFCSEGDELWRLSDEEMGSLAVAELATLGLVGPEEVLDVVVMRVPKAYPAYFGSYPRFDTVRRFTDTFANLYLIGRNGQHRYNNQDHSMLTAMQAVSALIAGRSDKTAIWDVNADREYHEAR